MISAPIPASGYTLHSIAATERFGALLGSLCKAGDVLCLGGDLGAGKTTLAQALAKGIGIDQNERVNSPSFALLHEYPGTITIYHMDFYRLRSGDDVVELGLEEYFYADGIVLVEWFERAPELIPPEALYITLTPLSETARKVVLKSSAETWQMRLHQLEMHQFEV